MIIKTIWWYNDLSIHVKVLIIPEIFLVFMTSYHKWVRDWVSVVLLTQDWWDPGRIKAATALRLNTKLRKYMCNGLFAQDGNVLQVRCNHYHRGGKSSRKVPAKGKDAKLHQIASTALNWTFLIKWILMKNSSWWYVREFFSTYLSLSCIKVTVLHITILYIKM